MTYQCLIDSNIRKILMVSIALLLAGCPTEGTDSNAPTDPEDYLVAPVADAGGPYSGDQGNDIALDGSASSDDSGIATRTIDWPVSLRQ
jgi:hypothetical protein